jgi:hypothetical protein
MVSSIAKDSPSSRSSLSRLDPTASATRLAPIKTAPARVSLVPIEGGTWLTDSQVQEETPGLSQHARDQHAPGDPL